MVMKYLDGIALTRDKFLLIFENITNQRSGACINIWDLREAVKGKQPRRIQCFRTQYIKIPSDQSVTSYKAVILQDTQREDLIVSGFVKANTNQNIPLPIVKFIGSSYFSRDTLCILAQYSRFTSLYCCTLSVDHLLDPTKQNLKMKLQKLKD